jgi:hypothetical protein
LQNVFNNLIRCYFFFLCLGQIRQVAESLGLTSGLDRIIFVYGIYIFYPVFLFILFLNSRSKFNPVEILLYFFLIGYPVLTLGFFFEVPYNAQYQLTDVLMPGVFFLCIALSKKTNIDFSFILKTKWVPVYLIVCTVTILLGLGGEIRYHSFGSVQMLFLFAYYFHKMGKIPIMIVVVDILLSGKRGLLVAALAFFANARYIQIVLAGFLLMIFVSTELIPSKYLNTISLLGVVPLLEVIGPRGREIVEVLSLLNSMPLAFFTGFGSGFYYMIPDSNSVIQIAHNVHFSPLGLLSTYGLVYCATVYIFLIKIVRNSSHLTVFSMYAGLSIIYSLTAYSLFVDFLFLLTICGLKSSVRN